MTRDRREINRQFRAVDAAYRAGDMAALRAALGDPPDFPNCVQPSDIAVGDHPLEYAIYWSPLAFIEALIALGADPDHDDPAGFPPLIAALSADRPDRLDVVRLLLASGADTGQRGINDGTPLHFAVSGRDLKGVLLLLEYGADATLRTRIDDCSTPLEDAKALGFDEIAEAIRAARRAGDTPR